jgi:tetratricopeptide (TPR) repeat protein
MDINATIQTAIEHHRKGDFNQAAYLYNDILSKTPQNPDILAMLGALFCQLGKYDLAIYYISKALQFRPSDLAGAYSNLGLAFQGKGLLDGAITHYQKALQLNPSFAGAHYNLGCALQGKELLDEAITHYQKALQFNPSYIESYCNIGRVLQEQGRWDESIAYFLRALEQNPCYPGAHCNLGLSLQEKGCLDQAITHYKKALQFDPTLAEAYCNLGHAFQEKGRFEEAVACYRKAIEINPSFANAHFNMAQTLLLSGNFKEGWGEYAWRWKTKDFLKTDLFHKVHEFTQPVTDVPNFKNKSLILYAEQGIGDEIMFASCLQEVIDQARRCTVECDRRLIPIFSRSFPDAVFIDRLKAYEIYSSQPVQADTVICTGSLPGFCRNNSDAFPQKHYLIPDTDKVYDWHERFRQMGEGLAVGISWRGGATPKLKRQRSIMLQEWSELVSLSGIHFINLQYGDCGDELKEVKEKLGITIHDWDDVDPLKELDNFAAQISALDLVISVDNATVHMAGALGRPVWTLLPYVPDWRWMLDREDSPWYPTMRLFRQPSPGDWSPVMAKVKDKLAISLGAR